MKIVKLVITLLVSVSLTQAQTPEEKGLAIAKSYDQADQGFESSFVKLRMVLRNKQGQESTRFMENKTLELVEDGDKSLIVFKSPKDVEGTATLTFTHKTTSDDQWLYLPAIKRVKRISSDNKSGPFMGSEFAYEDLSSDEVEKYTYKFLKNEQFNGFNTAVVEQDPVDPKSGYKRRVVWYNLDKNHRLEKIEFYDRKNSLLKTLTYSDYKQYEDKYWRAGKFLIINHQTGKETELFFEDWDLKTGLVDTDFSQNSLRRAGR